MEELISILSSCQLDASPKTKRQEYFDLACQLLDDDLSSFSNLAVPTCRSNFACERMTKLYLEAFKRVQEVEDSASVVVPLFLKRLCEILVQSNSSSSLVKVTGEKLRQIMTKKKDSSIGSLSATSLVEMAMDSNSTVFGPAAALGRTMLLSLDKDGDDSVAKQQMELLNSFLLKTLGGGSDVDNVMLLNNVRVASMLVRQQGEWDKIVLPMICKKLKSSPETSLEMISMLITHCLNDDIKMMTTDDDELVALLIKLLKSSKSPIRTLAQTTLIKVAECDDSCKTAVQVATTGLSSLSVPDQRVGVYHALQEMATYWITSDTKKANDDDQQPSQVLNGILTVLQKETKTATIAKEAGLCAVLAWMSVTKNCVVGASGTKGYQSAITYLVQPLVSTKPNGADFLFRWACVFRHPLISNDLQESIVLDAFNNNAKKMEQGLVTLLEGASSKKAATTTSCQEGLLSLYLLLLRAMATKSTKLHAAVEKVLKSGASSSSSSCFLFGSTMLEGVAANNKNSSSLLSILLPKCITVYVKWMQTTQEASTGYFKKSTTAACQAMAWSILFSTTNTTTTTLSLVSTLLTYDENVASSLLLALMECVNRRSSSYEQMLVEQQCTRQAREQYDPVTTTSTSNKMKGKLSPTGWSHSGIDGNIVRLIANKCGMALNNNNQEESLSFALLLMHIGTSHTSRRYKQRNRLMDTAVQVFMKQHKDEDDGLFLQTIAKVVAEYATSSSITAKKKKKKEDDKNDDNAEESTVDISNHVHRSSLSLISTLGNVGCLYDPTTMDDDDDDAEDMKPNRLMQTLCVKYLSKELSSHLESAYQAVLELTQEDMNLYTSPSDRLYKPKGEGDDDDESPSEKKTVAKSKRAGGKSRRKNKGGGGFDFDDDEEWEREMKKELAAKKKKAAELQGGTAAQQLSAQDKKLLEKQTVERKRIKNVLLRFERCCMAIQSLCLSDIEIGNACLPMLSSMVLQCATTSEDVAAFHSMTKLKDISMETLTILASCVYEMDETVAPHIARALCICCPGSSNNKKSVEGKDQDKQQNDDDVVVTIPTTPFPSTCIAASRTITEMEDYGDTLCGPSFLFLFPILYASIMGPRTTSGCEGALNILGVHTCMLQEEKEKHVVMLRKDMVTAILALLSHDRAQTFVNPTPYEVLVDCYDASEEETSSSFSTSEIAPILDERGALSSNHHCRMGAMMAAECIISNNGSSIKKNPLFENRIWVNCFDSNLAVRDAARKAWRKLTGTTEDDDKQQLAKPSPVYSIPLLPLLSSNTSNIALAAADANATAMGMYPSSIQRNLLKICTTYVESYPTSFGDPKAEEKAAAAAPALPPALPSKKKPVAVVAAAPVKKKKPAISTGLKKKSTKKSALDIAGIGKVGKPKTGKKKTSAASKAATAALLKPKEERTFDRSILENQFKAAPPPSTTGSGGGTSTSTTKRKDIPEEKDSDEKIAIRMGMLQALSATTKKENHVTLDVESLQLTTGFLMAYGLADGNDTVREMARNALRDVVTTNGDSEQAISFLLPNLERVLDNGAVVEDSVLKTLPKEKVPRDVAASDRRKEGAVVALGAVALHLKGAENEDKVDSTVDMLLSTLSTPSEGVQKSVADCLVKLMKKGRTQGRLESILSNLLRNCLNGETLALRRGSAYGLAAAVKGSGIGSLKKFEVVKKLEAALDTGSSTNKEGALFGIELLSARLGLLFEPYVIVLLPALLKSFSDGSDYVRMAASNTAGLIMSKLSAHGVKLVMPAVLKAFEDPAWRTKQASILMLGTMSHCAPKQLASALPKVVPKLTEAFTDTHPKVKSSAEEALQEISKVVKNPEISSISKTLLTALTEPSEGTVLALEALIETEFLHAIDAPSLALIVPILHRGLRDRVASTKRFGALIAGNICTMINDPKDFVPYLPILLPDLKLSLLDPIPDVRSTSAKALGSLTRGLGEESLPDLRSWLVDKLREDAITSAERSGAAHGLSEVLIAGGHSIVEEVMIDEILPLRSHPKAATREGVLWVLSFLPSALGQTFTPLIDESLPALIGGLSDESEPVRDVAMRAGRVLIRSLGKVHFDKILPSLEAGFKDDDYRIRVASLTLLGDLLSMIGGTSVVKGDGDTQEDIRKAERAQAQIALTLGGPTRKRVLSGLYLSRNDTTAVVRQSAVQVWKTVVSVTARTLRDILPVLVELIVEALASGHPEKTQVAGRCLGDIVSKLGESVLPEIIPVLRNALYEGDENTRRGVCVGLSEVISFSTRDQLTHYIDIIVKVVQDALCDEDAGVREMAAACFQSLHNVVGNRALDEIVPSLLVALEHDDDETKRTRALNGLTGILSIRSRELLPYIIPRLIKSPITKHHADALSGIAAVTGGTLHMHFASIIPAVITELGSFHVDEDDDEEEQERQEAIRDCCRSICRNVEEGGVNWLLSEISSKCGNDKPEIRCESCFMLQVVVEERKEDADFYEQLPIMLRELVYRLIDDDTKVLKSGNSAFMAVSTHVPAEELVKNIEFVRNLIASMVSDARRRKGGVGDGEFLMPGFNMPKGLDPLLPIYSEGILYGSPSIREVCASGLGELIALTSSKYLAGKLVVKMVGPLLRIVGDRNPSEVKIAILKTLGMVLVKGGPALRAFVPQFQTTFVKALADSSRQVRLEAIGALGLLMPLSTRVDPLMKELVAGSRGKDGSAIAAVQTATLEALAVVIAKGGKKAKLKESIPTALEASKDLILHEDEGVREAAAKVMGNACALLGQETTAEVLQDSLLTSSGEKIGERRHGKACALHRIFVAAGSSVVDERDEVMDRLLEYTNDDKSSVREAAFVALGSVVGSSDDPSGPLSRVEPVLLTIMKNKKESMEIHKAVAKGLCYLCILSSSAVEGEKVGLLGKSLIDACLELAMSGTQRVQFAYNDALWLALDVENGEDGLEAYNNVASFDNTKSMKSLFTKVLTRMKDVSMD